MIPSCKIDKIVGEYIEKSLKNNYQNILSKDERLEVISYLSDLPVGLLGWYPYDPEGEILQIGSWFGVFTEMLSYRCRKVTIVESDSYRAYITHKRISGIENAHVVNSNIIDYCKNCRKKFDYIIFVVDENIDVIPSDEVYREILDAAKTVLNEKGKLLFALPNRFGVKYFCGVPDPNTKIPFDGMTDNHSKLYRFDRDELLKFMKSLGFLYVKLYYPMPDFSHVQMIYTDDLCPDSSINERLNIYSSNKTERLLNEWVLMERLATNGVMNCFSNIFLVEAGNTPCSAIIYSALSAERDRDRAFSTNIDKDGIVRKIPLYPDGCVGIKRLMENSNELSARGIPVLAMSDENGTAVMKRICHPSLSKYLKDVVNKDVRLFIDCVDKLYYYIVNSSEKIASEKNCMLNLAPNDDWGVILKKAYLEMIPVNSFCDDGNILFYDQEFTKENCPANYVLFRALRDIYAFSPETEKIISLDCMKQRYGLTSTWMYYEQEEEKFQQELRKRNIYTGFFQWIIHLFDTVQENRKNIYIPKKNRKFECFNVFSNLDSRRIILFGSGRIADYYLKQYGVLYPPVFIVDNNSDKWGNVKNGIEIKAPESICRLMQGSYRVIIAIKDYVPVVEQLNEMGIKEDSYRIFDRKIDALLSSKIDNSMSEEKYYIGYIPDSFDSFGMDNLTLLKTCKAHSYYLIAGIFTDELLENDAFLEYGFQKPKIPFEERLEMIKQCKYVDRVVLIDEHNINAITAWKELRYGCLFERKEYENCPEQPWIKWKLNTLGSDIQYF